MTSIYEHSDLFNRMKMTPLLKEILLQENDVAYAAMGFNDRLVKALESWDATRKSNALQRRLKEANVRHKDAALTDIDFAPSRNINRTLIENLKTFDWVEKHQNLIITGKTGSGKTWIAGAFANAACHLGYTCRFIRVPMYLKRLTASHSIDQGFLQEMKDLRNVDLVVLDDWGLGEMNAVARSDLLEIIEQRYDQGSIVITSILPVEQWSTYIGDLTYADAILDRLVLNAHRIELTGESMRRLKKYGAV